VEYIPGKFFPRSPIVVTKKHWRDECTGGEETFLDGFGFEKDVQIERFTFTENGRFHFSMFYIKRINGEESVCVYWPVETTKPAPVEGGQ